MKRLRILIVLCIVALALVVSVLFVLNWTKTRFDAQSIKIPKIKADLEVGNLLLTEEKEGAVSWELEAKLAESYRRRNRTVLGDLRVTLYALDGRVVTLRGNRGRIDEKTRDMEVDGSVIVTSSDGLSLQTDSLHYSHKRREITTEDPVRIEGRGVTISGIGLRMELDTERFYILRAVETSIIQSPLESG